MSMATSRQETPRMATTDLLLSEEDLVATSPVNSEDAKFDAVVGELEDVLMDTDFLELQKQFFDQHCDVFDDTTDENKLEYTEIFHKYTRQIESYLSKRLCARIPWFSMKKFMDMIRDRPDQVEGDVFDMLHSLGDFGEFKDLIVGYKQDRDGRGMDLSGLIAVTSAKSTTTRK